MSTPRVISLYTGAGGLDYGLEAAGFDTAVAVEMDHDCCETLRHNRAWPVLEHSIFDVPTEQLLEVAGCRAGDIDLLIGGPPCQPFSKSGYWARGDTLRLDDPRASTLSAYLRVLKEVKPRAFLLENVDGLAYRGKDEGVRLLLGAIEDINRQTRSRYRPVFQVLNAAEHGVPQVRHRLIMVASRDGRTFRFPRPTHGEQREPDLFEPRARTHTAWDALADITPDPAEDLDVKGKWGMLLPSIPEGHNYLWHTDRMGGLPLFGWRRRYWSFLLKLAKALPSWTIQAQPGPATGPFHWSSRRLSMRELCRLQTFPADVVITGSRTEVQRQVGNAVPSLLGEVLGREIRAQLLDLAQITGAFRLEPAYQALTPEPEPVRPVPAAFRRLAGEHTPHPGTGKGNAARQRSVRITAQDALAGV